MSKTIVLKGDLHRNHDEIVCGATAIKPGMLVERLSTGKCQPHSTRGGKNQRMFAKEDGLRGGTIAGTLMDGTAYYVEDDVVFLHRAVPGDEINALLKAGENVSIGDWAISFGDGTVCKAASLFLANAVAASTALTNTVTETTFSNGSATIPKNTLKVGDVIRIRSQVIATSTNSTDTLTIKAYAGSTQLSTTGAVDVANNDIGITELTLVVRTIGATGTFVAFGDVSLGASGTVTKKSVFLGSTTIDTTADVTITVKGTWSVASASNSCRQDAFLVEHVKASSAGIVNGDVIGQFTEAKDLSASTTNDHVALEIAA